MSTDVLEHPTTEPAPEPSQPPTGVPFSAERIFRYSGWVHIGPDAEDCPDVTEDTNTCSNPLHFHAWCRLPNQWQHESIREKALAAKGRRRRQLKDPMTDSYEALEGALDEIAANGDAAKEPIARELVERDRWRDYAEAARDVIELEEGVDDEDQPVKPFEHAHRDSQRLTELEAMDEDDRPADEYEELSRHLKDYRERVDARFAEIFEPKVQALIALDVNVLLDQLRERRITVESNTAFMSTYSKHEWITCTLRHPGGERRFTSLEQLDTVAPEVYEALQVTFQDLEAASSEVVSGNS